MAQVFICDCCKEQIIKGRQTSDLIGFKDLCKECYQGMLDLKVVVKLTKKDILKKLKEIIKGYNV